MRMFSAILSVLMISVFAAGTTLSPAQSNDPFAAIPRLSLAEFKRLRESGQVVVVDVRDAEAYAEEHLAGAISIPLEQVVARAKELPRDKMIVTYCA